MIVNHQTPLFALKNNIIILILCFFHSSGSSQTLNRSFVEDSLDSYITRALTNWKIPGLAIAIVKDKKVIMAKGYGSRTLSQQEKVDENTLFMIGSNTKAFTGHLMAMLQDEKKCSLNDKVINWLPNFKMKDTWVNRELNLTDILCHRIGMETFQGDFMYWTSDLSGDEVLHKFGRLTPMYEFRSKWGYTNAAYLLAGECIQKISHKTWEENLKDRFFEPLEMKRTLALSSQIEIQNNVASPYTLISDTLKRIPFSTADNLYSAGSIASSAKDMSHWLLCQLDSGKYRGKTVIPFPVIEETRKPRAIVGKSIHPFNRSHYRLYGLGWFITDYEGREIISHTGGVNGFLSSVTLIPEENLGIVILTNTDHNYLFEALKWELIDAYLHLPYRNYSDWNNKQAKANAEKVQASIKAYKDTIAQHHQAPIDISNFAGKYTNTAYGALEIKKTGNHLSLTFEHHPNLKAELEYIKDNRFLCTYNDPAFGIKVFPFQIENNNVKSLKLSVDDFIEFTDYEFTKQ